MGTTTSRPADLGRPRLHRPRRRQPHLHAARRPGRPADRGPLAGQRADPPRQASPRRASRPPRTRRTRTRSRARSASTSTVEVDTIDFEILPGDQFLLCSDGLHAYLNDARIIDLLQGRRRQGAAQEADRPGQRGRRPRQHHRASWFASRARARPAPCRPTTTAPRSWPARSTCSGACRCSVTSVYKEILRLLNVTVRQEYAPGEEIIKRRHARRRAVRLLRGKMRLHKDDAFITHLEPGAHIGEMALVDRRHPRSASATAEERSRVLILSPQRFLRNHSQGTAAVDEAALGVHAGAGRSTAQDHRRALGRPPRSRRRRSHGGRAIRGIVNVESRLPHRDRLDGSGRSPEGRALRRADPAGRRELPGQRAAPPPPLDPRAGADQEGGRPGEQDQRHARRASWPTRSCRPRKRSPTDSTTAQFVVDIFQTGSGTSTNMNTNEVIANRAIEILGGVVGSKKPGPPQRPRQHGAVVERRDPDGDPRRRRRGDRTRPRARRWRRCRARWPRKATRVRPRREDRPHPPAGRGAGPPRPGVLRLRRRCEQRRPPRAAPPCRRLSELALGGTAVGTGINTHAGVRAAGDRAASARRPASRSRQAPNHFEALAARDAAVEASGALQDHRRPSASPRSPTTSAGSASGPRCGIGEISLPEPPAGQLDHAGQGEPGDPRDAADGLRAGRRQRRDRSPAAARPATSS